MPLLLATILPSFLIILFFVNSDKFREPTSEILKVFFYGILITIPAYFLNTYVGNILYQTQLSQSLIGSFFTAAPIEEGLKLSVMYFLVYKMKDRRGVRVVNIACRMSDQKYLTYPSIIEVGLNKEAWIEQYGSILNSPT